VIRPTQLGDHNRYGQIDPVLFSWAEERGIRLYFEDRESETRSFTLRNPRNRKYHVRMDYPAADGTTNIHVWRTDNRGELVIPSRLDDLRKNLDSAYDIAMRGRPTGEPTRLPPPGWIQQLLKLLRLDKP
jgi:hypothetical protein